MWHLRPSGTDFSSRSHPKLAPGVLIFRAPREWGGEFATNVVDKLLKRLSCYFESSIFVMLSIKNQGVVGGGSGGAGGGCAGAADGAGGWVFAGEFGRMCGVCGAGAVSVGSGVW